MYPGYLAKVNARMAITTPFDVDFTYTHNGGTNYTATVDISKVDVYDDDVHLYVFITESNINLPSPWGGLTVIHDVNRQMVPNQNGIALDFSAGNDIVEEITFDLDASLNSDDCKIVVAVQSNSTTEIFNGAWASMLHIYDNDVAVTNVTVPQAMCSNIISPVVEISNEGYDELTSASIVYSVNDDEEFIYEYTGSILYGESETVQLPEISYSFAGAYNVNVTIENPNNIPDEDGGNNSMEVETYESAYLPQNCKVAILTNDSPEETTWDIKNSEGTVIASGGPYSSSGMNFESFSWPTNDCYVFTIYDAGGDGLDGGFYKILKSNNSVIWDGDTDFGSEASAEFAYDELMEVNDLGINGDINVYPNPISSIANIEFSLEKNAHVKVDVYNLIGEKMFDVFEGQLTNGHQNMQIGTEKLDNGIYFINIDVDGNTTSKKVSILK